MGTDASGTSAVPNKRGIVAAGQSETTNGYPPVPSNIFHMVAASSGSTIGGTTPGAGNLVSGNTGAGLSLDGSAAVVQGNRIGTDLTGSNPLGNGGSGLEVSGSSSLVGGTASGAGNVIAFNRGDAVEAALYFVPITVYISGIDATERFHQQDPTSGQGITISTNAIFANQGQGIRLLDQAASFERSKVDAPPFDNTIPYTPAPGDPPRVNDRIAAPTLGAARTGASGVTASGTLLDAPSTTYAIEFFSDADASPQGRKNLGATRVTTDASGFAAFDFAGGVGVSATTSTPRAWRATWLSLSSPRSPRSGRPWSGSPRPRPGRSGSPSTARSGPGPANDPRNYAVFGPDGHALTVESALFDPIDDSVTLTTMQAPRAGSTYRVTVDGRRDHRVVDLAGLPLEGRPGLAGSSFTGHLTVPRPTHRAAHHPAGPRHPSHAHRNHR